MISTLSFKQLNKSFLSGELIRMCGIFGYYDAKNNPISDISLRRMAETIKYRGPDGLGYYHDEVSTVALDSFF